GHCLVDKLPRIVLADDDSDDLAKANVVGLHEITGPDLVCMVLEECRPRLAARRRALSSHSHILLDRAFGDNDAEFEQFAADSLSTPGATKRSRRGTFAVESPMQPTSLLLIVVLGMACSSSKSSNP